MNYRIFVEKREDFRVEAQNLMNDLKENVGIESLDFLRILNIYDVFNLSKEDLKKMGKIVFSEVNVDRVYNSLEEVFSVVENRENIHFAVEFIPGQYDQRADSAVQCINLLADNEYFNVKS